MCRRNMSILTAGVFAAFFMFPQTARTESRLLEKKTADQGFQASFQKVAGNLIAVATGDLKSGEQIPAPRYQDGSLADRKDCHYFVSPREISTAFTHLLGAGIYYIKCFVDEDGMVSVSLWQQGADGQEYDVSEDKAYQDLEKYYKTIGTQYEGNQDFRSNLVNNLRKRMTANYMVIAIRSAH